MAGLCLGSVPLGLVALMLGQPPGTKVVPTQQKTTGLVKEVFEDQLLLLSVGSADGLEKGDRVNIYRLKPRSVYVGRAEITSVGKRHSLARLTKAMPGQSPQIHDQITLAGDYLEIKDGSGIKLPGGAIIE